MSEADFKDLVSFFDAMAQTRWLSGVHDQLKDWTGSWSGKSVLDVGCGPGRILMRGVGEAEKLTGVDLSPEMIEMAKQNLGDNAALLTGDAYDLPFDDNTFDICLSTCVMFLLPEPEKGIAEMVRVTNAGGTIAMLNPAVKMDEAHAEEYCDQHGISGFEKETLLKWSHVSTLRHRYTSEQLSSILKNHGLQNLEHHEVLDGLALVTVGHK
ncbi:MAG TPA: methyltransferase domain-containing protein [Bacillales bacterium]|nr:methyltransferase domain-containing protein [Bacillales bacterium]